MNRELCRRCCVLDGCCILCGLNEHARCYQDFHRCDGGLQTDGWWKLAREGAA